MEGTQTTAQASTAFSPCLVCVRFRFLTVEEKKEVGRLCKLLIDHGRAEYLRRHGFRPALQYYAEPCVSLENVLLTAVPRRPCPAAEATA